MRTESVSNEARKSLRHVLEELLLTATQDEVARKLGVSQQWVHQHAREGGPTTIRKSKMPKIARRLGMTTMELAILCRKPSTE